MYAACLDVYAFKAIVSALVINFMAVLILKFHSVLNTSILYILYT